MYIDNHMVEIESFDFSYGQRGRSLLHQRPSWLCSSGYSPPKDETVTASVPANDPLTAELTAYNHAFCELELPWRWDATTLRQLKSIATDSDVVGAYVERSQAHLLRAYEKDFLRNLVLAARDRYQQEAFSTAA
jgi:hypothetical protein